METAKTSLRAEDMAKGIYTTVAKLPKYEPQRATLATSAAL